MPSNTYKKAFMLVVTSTIASTQVAAQEAGDARAAPEEVIVSARKINESVQDTPVTVTALTAKQLEKVGATDLKDVLGRVPGLAFSNVERGLARYNIRGIASAAAAPTVGVYLDDISLVTQTSSFAGAFDALLFDIERLEVLKGPQGTLYGGNSMGGAIKYVSVKPDLSEQSLRVAAGAATTAHGDESYNTEAVINIPLVSDTLALRAGVSARHDGGFIDNVPNLGVQNTAYSSTASPTYTPLVTPSLSNVTNEDHNDGDIYVARVSLLWQPDPSLSIRPSAIYQDNKLNNPGYFFTNQSGLVSSYRVESQKTTDKAGIYSLDVNKTFGKVALTSLTGYFDRDQVWDRDYSYFLGNLSVPSAFGLNVPGGPRALYPFTSLQHVPTQTQIFSQEFRVASADPTAKLTWLVGLFYSTQDEHSPGVASTYGAGYANDVAISSDTQRDREDTAVFGEVSYALTDALQLTVGARAFEYEQESVRRGAGPLNGGVATVTRGDNKEDGVNPKVGLSYRINDEHLLYSSAAKGFRPGGQTLVTFPASCLADLNSMGFDAPPDSYDFDSLWTYELGSKNQFQEGRMLLNGALFYSDWEDIQQTIRLPNCGFGFFYNTGTARVRGAEIDTQFFVTQALQFGANATYTDAEITEPGFGSLARVGDEIQDTPEWMASAFANFSLAMGATWKLDFRADYQYRSSQRRQFATSQLVRFPVNGVYPSAGAVTGTIPYGALFQDSYDVVNAGMSLDNGSTVIRLYMNNVLDERPLLDTDFSVGVSRSTTLRPRTIGFEVRQSF